MRSLGLKPHLIPLLTLILSLAPLGALSTAAPVNPETSVPEMREVAAAEQEFALNLYASMIADREGENLFFSPHSVYSVMAMAAEGANGKTAEQMAKVLGLDESDGASQFASTHSGLAGLGSSLRGRGGKDSHTLLTANAVWVDKSFPLAPAYQQALKPYLNGGGGVFGCDFHNRYDAEAKRIDQWCDDNTRGRITSIMPQLTPEEAKAVHMVLTNAVYFEGKWVKPFEPKDTKPRTFHRADGTDVETSMMNTWDFSAGRYGAFDEQGEWFATPKTIDAKATGEQQLYPAGKGFTMAELPYKGDRLSMVLIAPTERDGLPHVEKLMTPKRLTDWLARMERRNIAWLCLPKLDLKTTYNLTRDLTGLGMELAFDASKADLSRMVASSDPNLQLYLSMVIHKATLEVDEQGTVAAAVTGVFPAPMAAAADIRPFEPVFVADRPFLMLIRDKETGDILFMGRINNPGAEASRE